MTRASTFRLYIQLSLHYTYVAFAHNIHSCEQSIVDQHW